MTLENCYLLHSQVCLDVVLIAVASSIVVVVVGVA